MRAARSPALFDERGKAADLEGAADFVERVAVVAHDATGLGDVLEFLRKIQQGELPSGTLSQGSPSNLLSQFVV